MSNPYGREHGPIHYLMENSNVKVDAELLKTIDGVAPDALTAVD